MCGSSRKSCFQLLVENASGKLDLLHTTPPPLGVVLFLPRCFLQDPIFIEFPQTLLALFYGGMWWKTAHNGCLGHFKAGICLHRMIVRSSVKGYNDVKHVRISTKRH